MMAVAASVAARMSPEQRARAIGRFAASREAIAAERAALVAAANAEAAKVPIRPLALLHAIAGVLPDDATAFDSQYPGVGRLDPALLRALQAASTDAARGGITIHVTSGWRSPAYQDQLLRQAVATYGSEAAAAHWVATADTSAHVVGNAVDLGPSDATAWLSAHGARYGLCQIYRNEPWHYELRPDAVRHGCPAMYADPTQDPRLSP